MSLIFLTFSGLIVNLGIAELGFFNINVKSVSSPDVLLLGSSNNSVLFQYLVVFSFIPSSVSLAHSGFAVYAVTFSDILPVLKGSLVSLSVLCLRSGVVVWNGNNTNFTRGTLSWGKLKGREIIF